MADLGRIVQILVLILFVIVSDALRSVSIAKSCPSTYLPTPKRKVLRWNRAGRTILTDSPTPILVFQ